jgi:hypothetical protein
MQLLTATNSVFNTEEWPASQGSKVCVFAWPLKAMVQVKLSLYRTGQALRVPGRWSSQISWQMTHEGGKVVSPTHRPSLAPNEIPLVLISVKGQVYTRAIVRPEGLCQWKIPVTPSETETLTTQLIGQCLNQLRHRVPPTIMHCVLNGTQSVTTAANFEND